jgi:two-component system, NarL family, sensor kinase
MSFAKQATVIYFLLFFSIAKTSFGQGDMFTQFDQKKDKAVAELKKYTKQDTARANALIRVFSTSVFLKQQKQVKPYCDEAMTLSKQLNYKNGVAKCYLFNGNFSRSSGNKTMAHAYFDSLIAISMDAKDSTLLELRAQAYRWKGMIYYMEEDYYEALPDFFEALKYYDYDIGYVTVYMYTNIANIYAKLNNLDQAIYYATKNVAISEKGFPPIYKIQAYLGLVDIYLIKKELKPATAYLDKVKPYMPDSNETTMNFSYYENRGRVFFLEEKYDSSYSYYKEAYRYATISNHEDYVNTALYYLSSNALKLGKNADAKKYGEQNLAIAQRLNTKEGRVGALLNLSDYYNKAGNPGKAFELLQKATDLKDSLLSETNIKQANTLAAVYETSKKQNEIIRLQNEKTKQGEEVEQKSMLNKIYISTIMGLLFFGYLAYRTIKSEKKIAGQQQEIQNQKINELEKDKQLLRIDAMLKGQEEERSRIAKDLHDGLGGMLSGIKFSFVNMKDHLVLSNDNAESFDRSIDMLDNTISELRKVAHNLMPETLLRFGLEESLKDFCHSIETSTGIKVIYQQLGEERKLSTRAEIALYRIVQELVNNALKHADAKQIIVQLTKNHVKTTVTVEDDGKGFDTNILDSKKGAGFNNIKYRVNYFKGALDINSQPGNGTSVNIELIA